MEREGGEIGTQVSGDADEAPQRRRPTTSARRQWAAAPVVEDVEHVDHAANEVHEQPQEVVTGDVCASNHEQIRRGEKTA